MSFEATKTQWSEIYTLFRLLADGKISVGTIDAQNNNDQFIPVAMIQRVEHNGIRQYFIEKDNIRIIGENINKIIPREDFEVVSSLILKAIKNAQEENVVSPEVVEEFMDEIQIYNLEAKTEDRTDISIAFWTPDNPLTGFSIRSRIGRLNLLLDGGRAANLKFELSGAKFANPTVNKVNALDTPNEVADRMMLIESLGGILKYSDVADRVFRCNLLMIDLHFPRLLAEMLRIMQLDGINRVSELIEIMKKINPVKIKDELINKHGFYEYKMKQFLSALVLGMRPAKIYTGTDSAIQGIILVSGEGNVLCYHKENKKTFEDFLYYNTRFEKGSTEKDKYGFLEKENGVYYFKLNAKIGLVKR